MIDLFSIVKNYDIIEEITHDAIMSKRILKILQFNTNLQYLLIYGIKVC